MSETNELGLKAFKEKLNIYFSKDKGEQIVEDGIEEFSKLAVAQNKDDNPFFYGELLSAIKSRNITFSELVSTNGQIANEIFKEATNNAILLQKQVIDSQINQNGKTVANLDDQEIEKEKIRQEILFIQRAEELVKKYGGVRELIEKGTVEEKAQYVEAQVKKGTLSEVEELSFKKFVDPNYVYTDEEKRQIANSEMGKKFGFDFEGGNFKNGDILLTYFDQSHSLFNLIQQRLENGEAINRIMQDISQLRAEGEPTFQIVFETLGDKDILEKAQSVKEYVDKEKSERGSAQRNPTREEQSIQINGFLNENAEELSQEQLLQEIELSLDAEFAITVDFAEIGTKNLEDRQILEANSGDMEQFAELQSEVVDSMQPPIENFEIGDDQAYETPTFETEKKGFAKLFDKFRNSNNPVARLLFSKSKRVQANDAKRLEAGSTERGTAEYKEKPSTGRFDLSDSDLMPRGASIRNTFIRMGETVAKLFGKKDKEPEPMQTLVPQTPSTSFDAMVKKGIDDKVMDGIAEVSQQVAQQDGKPIVPKAVGKGENSKSSGPSIEGK